MRLGLYWPVFSLLPFFLCGFVWRRRGRRLVQTALLSTYEMGTGFCRWASAGFQSADKSQTRVCWACLLGQEEGGSIREVIRGSGCAAAAFLASPSFWKAGSWRDPFDFGPVWPRRAVVNVPTCLFLCLANPFRWVRWPNRIQRAWDYRREDVNIIWKIMTICGLLYILRVQVQYIN